MICDRLSVEICLWRRQNDARDFFVVKIYDRFRNVIRD